MTPWPDFDLAMWEYMTGTEAPRELVKRILPGEGRWSVTEKGCHLRLTTDERASWQEVWEKLGYARTIDEVSKEVGLSLEVCEDIGAKPAKAKGGKKR